MTDRSCDDCPVHSRREFMRDAARSLALTLAAMGIAPGIAAAMPRATSASSRQGTELRYPIPAVDGAHIDTDAQVILARTAGRVFAFSLSCPHQRTALRWEAANGRFRCPKHKSVFRPDGTFVEGRAKRPMDRFAVRREGNSVVVDVGTLHRFDTAQAAWERAAVDVGEK